jgi:hypothetical protein
MVKFRQSGLENHANPFGKSGKSVTFRATHHAEREGYYQARHFPVVEIARRLLEASSRLKAGLRTSEAAACETAQSVPKPFAPFRSPQWLVHKRLPSRERALIEHNFSL